MIEKNDDIFVELAKAKSMKIEVDDKKNEDEEEVSNYDDNDEDGQLTVDVYQDKDNIVVQSTVAGVHEDDLDIHITNESVSIHGKREKSQKIEDKDYFYQECFWGTFSRSIILPSEVDPEKSLATLKNGVLTIKMPKLNRKKAKKLKVKID